MKNPFRKIPAIFLGWLDSIDDTASSSAGHKYPVTPLASTGQTGLFAIPEPLKNLLGYAAIAYALGFLTITLNTARYGVTIIELARSLNLWVGAVPALAVAGAMGLWRKRQPQHTRVYFVLWLIFFIVATAFFTILFYVMGRVALFQSLRQFGRLATPLAKHPERIQSVIAVIQWTRDHLFVLCSTFGSILALGAIWSASKDEPAQTSGRNRLFTCIILGFVSAYVLWIYPNLPQQYGFGKPASVVLILKREAITDGMRVTSPGISNTEQTVATVQVHLIYKAEKEYLVLCDTCNAKIFSLPADAVKAVIWSGKAE